MNRGGKDKSELIFHKALVELGQVEVTVLSDPKYIKSKDAYVIDLEIDGDKRGYWVENEDCLEFLKGRKGETLIIEASGSREEAEITGDGASVNERASERGQRPPQCPPVSDAGYKPMGATVGMCINNACASMTAEGLPFDKFEITRRASILLRMSRTLEGGFLLKEDAKPPFAKEASAVAAPQREPAVPASPPSDDVPF